MEPLGTSSSEPFYGANQIVATTTDSMFFDKVLNNMKLNGFAFDEIDRMNGFISPKSKTHPKYSNLTMYFKISYIKDDGKYMFIFAGDYHHQPYNMAPREGPVFYTKSKLTNERIVWDEMMRQLQGIPNVSFTYRRI